ncbi:MAG: hypothetical protein AB7P00_42840, partial [Sandaracinaceae bacterium]
AVVSMDTPLYAAPSRGATQVHLLPAFLRGREPRSYRMTALRVLGEVDGWVELETPGELERAPCVSSIERLRPFRIRLFARADALLPVTAREVTQTFADDTAITLDRGVPLEPLPGTPLYRALLGNLSAVIRLAGPEVSTRYFPSEPRAEVPTPNEGVPTDVLARGALILGETGRVEVNEPDLFVPVYGARERGTGERILELRTACAVVFARAPSDAPASGLLGVLSSTPDSEPPQIVLRAGASLSWPDGSPAGEMLERVELARRLASRGDRRCFAVPVRDHVLTDDDDDATIELCTDAAHALDPTRGPADALDAP